MTRDDAVRAVVEAAEILAHGAGVIRGKHEHDDDIHTHELEHIRHLNACIAAYRALPPAEPVGEVVEVEMVLWEYDDGGMFFVRHDSREDGWLKRRGSATRLGTTRLPVIRASVASVEGEG